MRSHRARHFRFAGNAVTTRILRRLQVQTTSSSRPCAVSPNSVWSILTAALVGLEWQRSAQDALLGLGRHDAVPGDVGTVGVIPVEGRQFSPGHPSELYTLCPYTARAYAGLGKHTMAADEHKARLLLIRVYLRSSAAIFFLRYVGSWRDRGENAAFTKSIAVLVAASASPSRTGTMTLTNEVSLRWYRMESAISQNLAANSPAMTRSWL